MVFDNVDLFEMLKAPIIIRQSTKSKEELKFLPKFLVTNVPFRFKTTRMHSGVFLENSDSSETFFHLKMMLFYVFHSLYKFVMLNLINDNIRFASNSLSILDAFKVSLQRAFAIWFFFAVTHSFIPSTTIQKKWHHYFL